jgi:hypothetical protein
MGRRVAPTLAQPRGLEKLSTALQEMMWHSDSARTREITDTYGDSKINAFGLSMGMQKFGNEKAPLSLVLPVRSTPVSLLDRVIVTVVTAAPAGSVARPVTVARGV